MVLIEIVAKSEQRYARIFAVSALLGFFPCALSADIGIGGVPPDRLGSNVDNHEVRVSLYKGKVVVVAFWATWCTPCKSLLPALENLQRDIGTDRIEIIGIDYMDNLKAWGKVEHQLHGFKMTFTRDPDGKIGSAYGVKEIPYLLVIGKDGRISYIETGYDVGKALKLARALRLALDGK